MKTIIIVIVYYWQYYNCIASIYPTKLWHFMACTTAHFEFSCIFCVKVRALLYHLPEAEEMQKNVKFYTVVYLRMYHLLFSYSYNYHYYFY